MKIEGFLFSAVLAAVTTLASETRAQSYFAEWWIEAGSGTGGVVRGTVTSPVMASVGGDDFQPWNGVQWRRYFGSARSTPGSLETSGGGGGSAATLYSGRGKASWEFQDVVFSDGGVTPQPISVRLSFDLTGSLAGTNSGSYINVLFGGAGFGFWASPRLLPGSTPQTVTTSSINLMSNVVYSLKIESISQAGAGNGSSASADATVVWNDPPFLLPAGVTADSVEAGITNNLRTASGPAILPKVMASAPTIAGQNTTISFSDGQPGSVGAYLLGFPPDGTSTPILHWFVLDLPVSPLVSVPFVADASGDHSVSVFVDGALSGASLGVQAVQVYQGPPDLLHGTNAWRIDIQ